MSLFDAMGWTILIRFFWPLMVAVPVLIYTFRIVGNMSDRAGYESTEVQKDRLRFVQTVFWVGIAITVLCALVWFSPEISDYWNKALEAYRKAKG
jgi:hypothetical protein